MKIKTRPIRCEKACMSNAGNGFCMWKINNSLLEKAMDKAYRSSMCPIIKEIVEKILMEGKK